MADEFAIDLPAFFADNEGKIRADLDRYFAGRSGSEFTGRWFEAFAARSDPDAFGPNDLLAVEALSVSVPPESAARLLLTESERFNDLLRQIPHDLTLWEADAATIAAGSPADRLHARLRELNGVEWVTAGKLLAAKRPALIPVYDNQVKRLLNPGGGAFWEPLRDVLADSSSRAIIERVTADAPGNVSLLRRIDVALWMATRP